MTTTRSVAGSAMRARRSTIRRIFDAAQGRPDLIRLEIGEPSFRTPQHIIDGAMRAAAEGHTGYGPNGGLQSLRELLVDKLARVDGITAEPGEIVVTPGGMNALFTTYLTLLEPGDQVLLPSPGFPIPRSSASKRSRLSAMPTWRCRGLPVPVTDHAERMARMAIGWSTPRVASPWSTTFRWRCGSVSTRARFWPA